MQTPLKRTTRLLVALALLADAGATLQAQHGHLNAGALGINQGDKLYFANGDIFAVGSGYAKQLLASPSGVYAGFYAGNITLTALPTTVPNGGPVPGAPAPGSYIQVGIVSVSGPAGGKFGFWEHDATTPTLSYASGFTTDTPSLWALSDAALGAGTPGGDPFGHLHGRQFTTTVSGEYTIEFQLYDTSINGLGGGAIHSASDSLAIRFTTVPEPPSWALLLSAAALTGVMLGKRYSRREG